MMTTCRVRITASVGSIQYLSATNVNEKKSSQVGRGLKWLSFCQPGSLSWTGGDVMSVLLGAPANSQAISLK